jgi:hypothetical protein
VPLLGLTVVLGMSGCSADGGTQGATTPMVPSDKRDKTSDGWAQVGDVRFDLGAGSRGTAVQNDEKVFYANTALDTDTLVVPQAAGLETFYALRSVRSPESFEMTFEVTSRATATRTRARRTSSRW